MMGDSRRMLLALLLLSSLFLVATGLRRGGEEEEMPGGRGRGGKRGLFILDKSKRVVKTKGGEVRVVNGYRWRGDPTPMNIGFIHMEPNTLFIPQYIDSDIVLFVRQGTVRAGWIHEGELVEKELKAGDINAIPAGSAFYMVNKDRDERLHIICSIDSSESLGYNSYQSFFLGGGTYPTSVLAGFDHSTLSAAFNVTMEELGPFMKRQVSGPIIYMKDPASELPRRWAAFLLQEREDGRETGAKSNAIRSPDSYNLYERDPSFKNSYGWTVAIDGRDYAPLDRSGISIYYVNLTMGSMLAPHVNPTATEYGIVLGGAGTIEVVFPNGSAAMNAVVEEGDVFWIPRYFPFSQLASRGGPMELFGFTTSARRNRPQFLAGASSVLRSMSGPELAAGFGVSEERLGQLVKAQKEEVILPLTSWVPAKEKGENPLLVMKRGVMFA